MRIIQASGLAVGVVCASMLAAFATPFEPPRGSELRQDVLDAVRVVAEYEFGAPVEFVVIELQVDGVLAFARVMPQRPGGGAIDLERTPMFLREGLGVGAYDGVRIEAFADRSSGRWMVGDYAVGASDVWWYRYNCTVYGSLLRQYGC